MVNHSPSVCGPASQAGAIRAIRSDFTEYVDGILVPKSFDNAAHYRWAAESPQLDWRTISFDDFERLTDLANEKLSEYAVDNADLSGLRDSGGKLLITQAADDEVVPYLETMNYFERVIDSIGSADDVSSFARLFVTDGDIHGVVTGPLPGLSMATAMTALMRWVEDGQSPDVLEAERVDVRSGKVVATRPVYPYPIATRYSGTGPAEKSASYVPVPAHKPVR